MKSFKKFLHDLKEEKIIAREDYTGASATAGDSGDVSSPSNTAPDTQDVLDKTPTTDFGLKTTDVLGKCDHHKDGIFGPGCFHLPCIWGYSRRIPNKKKRKHLPFEKISEDQGFGEFRTKATDIINRKTGQINQDILQRIDRGLRAEFVPDYRFHGETIDWIASPVEGDDDHDIKFAVNIPALYNFLYDNDSEDDDLEIDLQITNAVFHEIGHGIIDFLSHSDIYDMELSHLEAEKMADEYGRYAIRKYSEQYTSKLNDTLHELFDIDSTSPSHAEVQDTGSDSDVNNNPIDLTTKDYQPDEGSSFSDRCVLPQDVTFKPETGIFSGLDPNSTLGVNLTEDGYLKVTLPRIAPAPTDLQLEMLDLTPEQRKRYVDTLRNFTKVQDQQTSTDKPDDFLMKVLTGHNQESQDYRNAIAEDLDKFISTIDDSDHKKMYSDPEYMKRLHGRVVKHYRLGLDDLIRIFGGTMKQIPYMMNVPSKTVCDISGRCDRKFDNKAHVMNLVNHRRDMIPMDELKRAYWNGEDPRKPDETRNEQVSSK